MGGEVEWSVLVAGAVGCGIGLQQWWKHDLAPAWRGWRW